jgi:hypothetical protein
MNNLLLTTKRDSIIDYKTRIFKHDSLIDRKTRILLLTYPVSLTICCLRQNLSSSPFTGGEPLRVNNEDEPVSDTWCSPFPPVGWKRWKKEEKNGGKEKNKWQL